MLDFDEGVTDGGTDRRTDRRTDRPSYRDARTHLKRSSKFARKDHPKPVRCFAGAYCNLSYTLSINFSNVNTRLCKGLYPSISGGSPFVIEQKQEPRGHIRCDYFILTYSYIDNHVIGRFSNLGNLDLVI